MGETGGGGRCWGGAGVCPSSQLGRTRSFRRLSSLSTVASSSSMRWALLASAQEGRSVVVTVTHVQATHTLN